MKSGWEHVALAEIIAAFDAGVSVNGMDRPARAGEHGVLKVSAVTEGRFKPEENKAIRPVEMQRAGVSPHKGDILISRANTIELVGASALVDRDYPLLHLSDKLWRVVLADERRDDRTWLSHVLGSAAVRKALRARATGSSASMKNVSQNAFLAIEVPRPPAHEQRKLGALFQRFDRVIEHMTRLIFAKRQLMRGLMLELLTGRRRFPQHRDTPWDRIRLGDLVSIHSGGTPPRSSEQFWGDEVPWITAKDMKVFCLSNSQERLSAVGAESVGKLAHPGDVLVLVRGNLADHVPVGVAATRLAFNQDIKMLSPRSEATGEFIARYLQGVPQLLQQELTVTGHGVGRLATDQLARVEIHLPPLDEQHSITSALAALDREIDLLEAQRAQFEVQKRGLLQWLLSGKANINAGKVTARHV